MEQVFHIIDQNQKTLIITNPIRITSGPCKYRNFISYKEQHFIITFHDVDAKIHVYVTPSDKDFVMAMFPDNYYKFSQDYSENATHEQKIARSQTIQRTLNLAAAHLRSRNIARVISKMFSQKQEELLNQISTFCAQNMKTPFVIKCAKFVIKPIDSIYSICDGASDEEIIERMSSGGRWPLIEECMLKGIQLSIE